MPRQYVACKFCATDKKSFTYHYDGEEVLFAEDSVKVPDRSGDGWKRVIVVAVSDEAPPFPTKGIIGKIEPEQPDLQTNGEGDGPARDIDIPH